jgi:hypothetical protein
MNVTDYLLSSQLPDPKPELYICLRTKNISAAIPFDKNTMILVCDETIKDLTNIFSAYLKNKSVEYELE